MSRLYRNKTELKKALSRDIASRKRMRKQGHSTKGITQAIKNKRRILKSKKYWKRK